MTEQSIKAYDSIARIERYDRDMDIMHFARHEMVDIALRMIPFPPEQPIRVLDLGVGTGLFSLRCLERFANASLVALDGSQAMIDSARVRLRDHASRVDWVLGDFRDLARLLNGAPPFDLVISSYALHHLSITEKTEVIRAAVALMREGAWLVNADLIVARHEVVEERFQALRVAECVARAPEGDARFADAGCTRRHLDELEALDGDQPVTLREDLDILEAGGLRNVDVFWLKTREAVTGGIK